MKIKFNWGTGVVLGFIAFIAFILYFVLQLYTDSSMEFEMSSPDYYKEELVYQSKMERMERAENLQEKIQLASLDNELLIDFPSNMDYKNISGQLVFYRPSDQSLDFNINIQLDSSRVSIPKRLFKNGLWELTINWSYNSIAYTNIYKLDL